MTTEEFSDEFDTLLNSYFIKDQFGDTSNIASIALDEYEKSVYLTKAQEEIVIQLYSHKNSTNDSFEKTEEIRRYLSNLIKTSSNQTKVNDRIGLSKNSVFFELPDDLWFITYESALIDDKKAGCMDGTELSIIPVTQDSYYRISNNPFRCSNIRRALRLDSDNNMVEIISEYNISRYLIRYLSKPTPIVLTDLHDNLNINGIPIKTECILNPAIHRSILERAVQLALIGRTRNAGSEK